MDIFDSLAPSTVSDVLNLVDIGAAADGLPAIGEQPLLKLRHGHDDAALHFIHRDDTGRLTGYANLDVADRESVGGELLVHPMHRRAGVGSKLVTALLAKAGDLGASTVNVWAHGDHPSAIALADRFGFARARVLWQMRRRLIDTVGEPKPPEGVEIRTFVPGKDETKLLEVNNAAFSDHPDQSGWTLRDLAIREREDWFDPAGLFLAERVEDGELLGFHWTKVHRTGDSAIGEVYVLGVAPSAQGMRLGALLTDVGLRHLRKRGLDTVMLYVDESNVRAVRLYAREGFTRWVTDVSYRRTL